MTSSKVVAPETGKAIFYRARFIKLTKNAFAICTRAKNSDIAPQQALRALLVGEAAKAP